MGNEPLTIFGRCETAAALNARACDSLSLRLGESRAPRRGLFQWTGDFESGDAADHAIGRAGVEIETSGKVVELRSRLLVFANVARGRQSRAEGPKRGCRRRDGSGCFPELDSLEGGLS